MLLNDKEALDRINSPLNLMNRLRSSNKPKAMDLFVPPKMPSFNPFENKSPSLPETKTPEIIEPGTIEPNKKIDDILDDADSQIKLAHAHKEALETLNMAMSHLKTKMDDIKPDKLPSVISATSKVVEGIRKERSEAIKAKSGRDVHLHFYTPTQKKMDEYEVIEVG